MEGKGTNIIMLAVIAVLALALAVSLLMIFTTLNGMTGNSENSTSGVTEKKDPGEPEFVPTEQIYKFEVHEDEEFFSLKPEEGSDSGIVMAKIIIKCNMGEKNYNKEKVEELSEAYKADIRELIQMNINDIPFSLAQTNEMKLKLKQDIKDQVNELFDRGSDIKQHIVIDVILDRWFPQ